MESERPTIFRRTLIVERGSQIGLVLRVVTFLLVLTTVAVGVLMAPSAMRLSVDGGSLEELYAASREFLFLDLRVIPVLLVMVLVMGINFLFLSNRIFGPLWRLTRVIRLWREERAWPAPVRPRRRDYHAELFQEFSQSAAAVGEDLVAAREGLRAAVEQARALSGKVGPGEAAEGLRRVEEQCRGALERLERWKI